MKVIALGYINSAYPISVLITKKVKVLCNERDGSFL